MIFNEHVIVPKDNVIPTPNLTETYYLKVEYTSTDYVNEYVHLNGAL